MNTNWAVLHDGAGKYYLLATDHWLAADSYSGPWSSATAPASFANIPDTKAWTEVRAALHASALPAADVPHVYVSTSPADLVAVEGSPKLVAIPGTHLDYVENTGSNLFLATGSKEWFVLLSGRWYRSSSLNGPWEYATTTLPADFARIPVNSARGGVLVSVPGTPESEYVGATMSAPQITPVQANAGSSLSVTYAGTPQFAPIAGTSLSYALNTASDVIRVSDTLYYVCSSGVWYSSSAAAGPWIVAAYVPQAIYGIPATSPLYPDTYVYVYNDLGQPIVVPPAVPPVTIFVGYTAGYAGAYWVNSAWVYGTGYYYPGFYAPGAVPIYYPYAATWTGGSVYTGGSYYNSHTGYYGNQASVYGPYGGATAKSAYNPTTGTYARGGEVYGPNGEAAAGSFTNSKYGVSGSSYQQKTSSGTYGQSNITTKNGTTYAAHQSGSNGEAAASTGPHGSSTVAKSSSTGDVYAGHDGNVYKQSNGTWQKSNGSGGWSNVQTPSQSHPPTSSSSSQYHPPTSSSSSQYHPPTSSSSSQYHPPTSSSSSQYHPPTSSSSSEYHPPSSASQSHPSDSETSSLDHDSDARSAGSSGFSGFRGGGGGGGGFSGGGGRR